jgi:hypothetical protein
MIGFYIVDGILLLGLGYLCCSSHRRSSENLVNEEHSLEECNNYLSFNEKKEVMKSIV